MKQKTAVRQIAVLLTVLLVAASVAPSMAGAAPTLETSSSEIDDGTTIDGFNASAEKSSTFTLNNSGEGSDPGLKISVNGSDTVFYRNESGNNVSGNQLWNFSVIHSALADVPMGAGENVTMDATFYNKSNESDDYGQIQFYLNNTNERAVIYVGNDAADEDTSSPFGTEATIETDEPWYNALGIGDERSTATVEHDDLAVSGSDTKVYVILANSSTSDAYTAALDRAWFGQSSYAEGDFIRYQQLTLNGNNYVVVNEEVSDFLQDSDELTYGTYTTVDGQDAIVATLGETDFEDEDQVDVEAVGNDAYSWWTFQGLKRTASDGWW